MQRKDDQGEMTKEETREKSKEKVTKEALQNSAVQCYRASVAVRVLPCGGRCFSGVEATGRSER